MTNSLSVGSFIRFGWESFKKRPWYLIGAVLLMFIAQTCVSFVVGIIDGVGEASGSTGASGLLSFVVNMAGQTIITMGFIAFFLKAHDHIEMVNVRDAWHPQDFWKFIGLLILLYIIFIIGFLLLVVPGIIAILMFMFAPYLVVDRGMGPIEALKESARITKGHRWRILALLGAAALISIAGFLALFVGLLVAIPVTYLAYMHAYRTLSHAADRGTTGEPLSGGEKALVGVFLLIPIVAVVAILMSISLAAVQTAEEAAAVQAAAEQAALQEAAGTSESL